MSTKTPGEAWAILPVHYLIGWLGEYFPCLYKCRADSNFSRSYPFLARYGGIEAEDLDISSARRVFRTDQSVDEHPNPFAVDEKAYLVEGMHLTNDQFEWALSIRSNVLTVRMGNMLWLEPYYPNRFAHQFGYNQGVPQNRLQFGVSKRKQCCIEDLARAQRIFYRRETIFIYLVQPAKAHVHGGIVGGG